MPRLSVIVTSYNLEDYIGDCLEDIIDQTLTDHEIIVVDDGSSDRTPEIIRAFAERDPRIVPLLRQENSIGGVATAANAGIERARGTFIGFADGDDRYDREMFAKLVDAAERTGADLALCSYQVWDAATDETYPPTDAARWKELAKNDCLELTNETRRSVLSLNAVPWRKLYAKSLLKDGGIRFPVGDFFFEDNPFHWFNVLSAHRVAFVDEELCKHRVNRAGQTTATVDRKLLKMFDHHGIIEDWLTETGQDDAFRMDLLAWASRQLSWISRKCPEELQRPLFDAARRVAERYGPDMLASRTVRKRIGKRTAGMLLSATREDFESFQTAMRQAAEKTPKRQTKAPSLSPAAWVSRILGR